MGSIDVPARRLPATRADRQGSRTIRRACRHRVARRDVQAPRVGAPTLARVGDPVGQSTDWPLGVLAVAPVVVSGRAPTRAEAYAARAVSRQAARVDQLRPRPPISTLAS